MTIFAHGEHGKMIEETKATIDGTWLGPDAIVEFAAMDLYRLGAGEVGAAEALSGTFVADACTRLRKRCGCGYSVRYERARNYGRGVG